MLNTFHLQLSIGPNFLCFAISLPDLQTRSRTLSQNHNTCTVHLQAGFHFHLLTAALRQNYEY